MIPFEIPAKYLAGIENNTLIRIGTLIKDNVSGEIVAHLQETSVVGKLLNGVLSSPFSPINTISGISSNIQLANVSSQLSNVTSLLNTFSKLQYLNLGVSVAGIGVSAVGFMVMNKKLNTIQEGLNHLSSEVIQGFEVVRESQMREHYANVSGFVEQAEQAYTLKSPENEWRQIATNLATEAAFFKGELRHYLTLPSFDEQLFIPLLRSYALCTSARLECLMLADELPAARKVSADNALDCRHLFDPLSPTELATKMIKTNIGEDGYQNQFSEKLKSTKDLIVGLRDITDAASTKPILLDHLLENKIHGRAYLDAIKAEQEEPLIVLSMK